MKKQKGFTLIELLAIIVILAIIAVITVPIILNIIDNSRIGAATDSAYGYKDAVQKFYISKSVSDHTEEAPSGYKKVSSLSSEGFSVSGDTPTDGWVKLNKGQVIDYSLKFGDYVVSYDKNTNSAISVKNGEIGPMPEAKLYRNVNNELVTINKSEMQAGDIVILKSNDIEEHFIVLNDSTHIDPKAPTGTTSLLAINNLNVGPNKNSLLPEGYQGTEGSNYTVMFANTYYWSSDSSYDIYNTSKNEASGTNYSVAYYVNNYVTNLQNKGFTGINGGRILTMPEVNSGGLAESYKASGENYWTGTSGIGTMKGAVWCINNDGSIIGHGTSGPTNYSQTSVAGVRPLIYINTDDIE